MNPETSMAIRRAGEIVREREARDFRRNQLQQGALQGLYKDLKAEILNLVSHLQRTLGYRDLQVKEEKDDFEVWT
jgi:hypothetical protein